MKAASQPDVADLRIALRSMAPASVVVGVRAIEESDMQLLHPAEYELVAKAVLKRQKEFATGRALLRSLLGSDQAILQQSNRAARLPEGVCGSLAHDNDVAVAAISRDAEIRSLGIDVEPDTPLSIDMSRIILREDEAGIDAHLAFTLKEATYKAWSCLGGRFLDHHDVRVTTLGGTFKAHVVADDIWFSGRIERASGRYVALVVV